MAVPPNLAAKSNAYYVLPTMKVSKLTVKHQVTIPRDVRRALGLKAGDGVVWEVNDGKASVSKCDDDEPTPEEWEGLLRASMPEWFDPDEDAYWADL